MIADPENLGANEPVFLVEDGEAPSDLLEGMGCSFRELFEGLLAAHEDLAVFFLEVEQDVLSRGPSLGRDTFFQEIAFKAVVERVLEELDLYIGQGVLEALQPGLDNGHFVADQSLAFRRDAAEFIIQADRIEPANATVVEQLSDLGEILVGVVGERLLFLERR